MAAKSTLTKVLQYGAIAASFGLVAGVVTGVIDPAARNTGPLSEISDASQIAPVPAKGTPPVIR